MKQAFELTNHIFNSYGLPVLALLIVAFFLLETKLPLRKPVQKRWQRIIINVSMALPAFGLLRLLFVPAMVWIAYKNQSWHFGLNYLYQLPLWLEAGIAFIGLDYFIYLWHVLTHKVPLLWRFHLVHHTDLDLDVSTAVRFHFGELFFSIFFRGASVLITGALPLTVLVYEIVFEACNNFHHSNLRLPLKIEKVLNAFLVTPRMHGVHHSVISTERNSNWGTVFSFWDRLHNTFQLHKTKQPLVIGEAPYQDKKELTVFTLLAMPFRKIRK